MLRQLVSLLVLFAPCLLPTTAPGQRPKTAEQALQRFEKLQNSKESARRRATTDLGRFEGAPVTRVLLAELQRSESDSYRHTVVSALGRHARPEPDGVVDALRAVLLSTDNPRLCDQAAKSLGMQGAEGVAELGRVLAKHSSGMLHTAACRGLEDITTPAARDLLIAGVKRASGRARRPALAALAKHESSPALDKLRLQLAGDKDYTLATEAVDQLARHAHPQAAAMALQASRRTSDKARGEHHAAILHGLLRQADPRNVDPKHYGPILEHATKAQGGFDNRMAPHWRASLEDATFTAYLQKQGVGSKHAAERRAAAKALALVPEAARAGAAAALVRLLTDPDDAVVSPAAMSLAQFGRQIAMPPLLALIANGTDQGKADAALAIDVMCHDDGGWHGLLLGHSQNKSAPLAAAALRLLRRCEDKLHPQALEAAGKQLDNKSWRVRAAAIDLIVALRDKASVPLLIARVEAEKGRLSADLATALEDLTGLRFGNGRAWRAWWKKESDRFTVAAPKKGGGSATQKGKPSTKATYWNLPVHSDRVAFVVDSSGSMRAPFGTGSTRLDEAKRQLGLVLAQMPAKAKANIIAFATDVTPWASKLQVLSKKRKKAGAAFANELESRFGTNVHAALQVAFQDPEVDTIYLLTDGRPSAGEIIDWRALADEVARWNLSRGLQIHAVAIGEGSRMLERMAKESGGNYTIAR